MNAPAQIHQDEHVAREALKLAIAGRAETAKRLSSLSEELAELRKAADDRGIAFNDAQAAHTEAIEAGSSDKLTIATLNKASEAKSLLDVATKRAEQASEKADLARLQLDEAERTVSRVIGAVVAAIAENRAERAISDWNGIVHSLASLCAARARCSLQNISTGPALDKLDKLLIFNVAAHAPQFGEAYRAR